MKMTRIISPLALAAFSTAAVAGPSGYQPPAPAQDVYGAGTVAARIGASYINPLSDDVTFANDSLDAALFGDAFRANVDPDEEWGWNLSGLWIPIDHWGLELNYIAGDDHLGHRHRGRGFFDVDGERIGKYEADISTATVNWYPLDPSCMFQPYIGVGLAYTDFNDERFRLFRGVDPADFQGFELDGDFGLGYSWGYTWQVGVDWVFGKDSSWLVNAAAKYVHSETEMDFSIFADSPEFGREVLLDYSGDYRYNPWVFNLGVGYKFSF
ncbi:OmpW/AlkL family protein [Microbulbifer halophilus]|uniref:OmpW family protein n=1 Tax=Microbulbifer halophilus TaxID=453963 RepID=A0ABW5ECA8_9GAMM|nr:OmpW family outer membrane protein [Microbulbifer halophilus]MCW8126544.1 hypothetical protein [Microbulbifer halophilus]